MTLFEDGKKIGEISDFSRTTREPETKTVLGKVIKTLKKDDLCQFVSPKPVRWKNKMWLETEDGTKLHLAEIKVVGGTKITATIVGSAQA